MAGLEVDVIGATLVVKPSGRLDAHNSNEVLAVTQERYESQALHLVVNLENVSYLSSASLRAFLQLNRQAARLGGQFALAGVQPYCREVIRISGLDGALPIFETGAEALAAFEPGVEPREMPCGTFTFQPGSDEPGYVEVLGHIDDVLESRVTADKLHAKKFSAKGFSLGLGGLGPSDAEVLPLIGEMMTIGGTMVWLPTDGNDTPDFLVPKADSDLVTIRTAFNASLSGPFGEFVQFRAARPEGATLTEIFRAIFDLAKERRPDFHGGVGLAMRADLGAVYGSGVTKAPIAENAPKNGKRIIDPENFNEWFEVDREPRHREVTGLVTAVGMDLRSDLSAYNQDALNAAFYSNPANAPEADCLLHSHGVLFSAMPFPDPPRELSREIEAVVEEGDFIDMRHLFDRTTVTRALIGLIYVQDFRPDRETA